MNWPTHPAYKSSGVQWLGEVPAHWGLSPMFTVGHERTLPNKGLSEANLLSLSYGRIVRKDIDTTDGLLPASFETYQIVEPCDIVFRFTDLQNDKRSLRSALVPERGIITSAYMAFSPTQIDPVYFSYLMRSYDLTKVFYSRGGGLRQSLKYEDVKRLPILVPPTDEQRVVSRFLDRETAKIDALIDTQEQLIATLREDRAATITQAVTKGLDQSVELCRTGIDFMDAIPSHWSLRKLKHLVERFEQGVSPQASAELAAEGWGVLKSGCVNGGVFREIEHKKLPIDFEFDERLAVAVGDLLVCRASGSPNLVGSAAIVQKLGYQLILSDKIFRLTPNRRFSLDYLEWALNARPYREQVLGAISGAEGLANNLPLSSLRNFWFADPPIAEQQEIARFLGERCTKIDSLIAKSTEMIEALREYRSALITNAVTGKIDVREAV